MECTIGLIQADFPLEDTKGNLEKAERLIRSAKAMGGDLICLPEAFNTGYATSHMVRMISLSETLGGNTIAMMSGLAGALGVHLIVPLLLGTPGGICHNSAALISDEGRIVGVYSKTHLVPGEEMRLVAPGGSYPVFDTKFGRIGIVICNDLVYPEAIRMLGLQGAEIIFVTAAWRAFGGWNGRWSKLLACRAIDNQAVVAGVNRVGPVDGYTFSGGSMIVDTNGSIMKSAGENEETILIQTISLDEVRSAKKEFFDQFYYRRPDEYGIICQKDVWRSWAEPPKRG